MTKKDENPYQRRKKLKVATQFSTLVKDKTIFREEAALLTSLVKRPQSVGQLSRELFIPKESIIEMVDNLREKGFDVNLVPERGQVTLEREAPKVFKSLALKPFHRNWMRIGVVSDTHFGSKCQQPSLLYTAYKEFEEAKVEVVIHTGDVVDGLNMYKGHHEELFLHGADDQLDYTTEHYPTYKKPTGGVGKTLIIGGNHDDCYRKRVGFNIVRSLCQRREDLEWRGTPEATFELRDLLVGALHPAGGPGYARSYRPQRIYESVVSRTLNEIRIPNGAGSLPKIFFFGHFHTAVHLVSYMGTDVWTLPCLQAQTPYLKAKGLDPLLGYVILEVYWDKNGTITRVVPDVRIRNAYVKEGDF